MFKRILFIALFVVASLLLVFGGNAAASHSSFPTAVLPLVTQAFPTGAPTATPLGQTEEPGRPTITPTCGDEGCATATPIITNTPQPTISPYCGDEAPCVIMGDWTFGGQPPPDAAFKVRVGDILFDQITGNPAVCAISWEYAPVATLDAGHFELPFISPGGYVCILMELQPNAGVFPKDPEGNDLYFDLRDDTDLQLHYDPPVWCDLDISQYNDACDNYTPVPTVTITPGGPTFTPSKTPKDTYTPTPGGGGQHGGTATPTPGH